MGKLILGEWATDSQLAAAEAAAYKKSAGQFERGSAAFRNWVSADGRAGPSGKAGFSAQAGRYHLFAALNCPWAHRTLIYRQVKKLEPIIGLSQVAPARTEQGWVFDPEQPRFSDTLLNLSAMHQLYTRAQPDYTGRVTVPVLWDKHNNTIVSNESAEIIRMFNSAFNALTGDEQNFAPEHLFK